MRKYAQSFHWMPKKWGNFVSPHITASEKSKRNCWMFPVIIPPQLRHHISRSPTSTWFLCAHPNSHIGCMLLTLISYGVLNTFRSLGEWSAVVRVLLCWMRLWIRAHRFFQASRSGPAFAGLPLARLVLHDYVATGKYNCPAAIRVYTMCEGWR